MNPSFGELALGTCPVILLLVGGIGLLVLGADAPPGTPGYRWQSVAGLLLVLASLLWGGSMLWAALD